MKAKSLFAVSISVVVFLLLVLPEAPQCGVIYSCNDGSGIPTFSDRDLGGNYKCVPAFSVKDITEDERRAWEIENKEKAAAIRDKETREKQKREIDQRVEQVRILNDQQRRKEEQRIKEQSDMLKREEDRRIREEQRRERALQIQEENLRMQEEQLRRERIKTTLEIQEMMRSRPGQEPLRMEPHNMGTQ